jgi:hypothetical protein
MNLVAADVRRLHLNSPRTIRASSRRLLRLRGSMREIIFGRNLPEGEGREGEVHVELRHAVAHLNVMNK